MKKVDFEGTGMGCLIIGTFLVMLLVPLAIGFGVVNALHEEEHVCTVETKERIPKGDGIEQRVYMADCDVMTVGDALLAGHFTSASTWQSIEDGSTYRLTTRGYRIGFLSMFPNIIEVKEIET